MNIRIRFIFESTKIMPFGFRHSFYPQWLYWFFFPKMVVEHHQAIVAVFHHPLQWAICSSVLRSVGRSFWCKPKSQSRRQSHQQQSNQLIWLCLGLNCWRRKRPWGFAALCRRICSVQDHLLMVKYRLRRRL